MNLNIAAPDRLNLREVTICAADSAFVDLTARALTLSMQQVDFADAILFSDTPRSGPFRNVQIPPLRSVEAYSRFCLRDLPDFIRTTYALVIQWDGYVVNPHAWMRAFLKYDYIGSVWHNEFKPEVVVGNGGFSLRSRRLLQAVQKMPPVGPTPEDRVICRVFRSKLESDFGFRFAPIKLAEQFGHEDAQPELPTFGFHGVHHLARYCGDDELTSLVNHAAFATLPPQKMMDLLLDGVRHGRTRAVRAVYRRLARKVSPIIIKRVLGERFGLVEGDARFAEIEALSRG